MARPIKETPILRGKDARRFLEEIGEIPRKVSPVLRFFRRMLRRCEMCGSQKYPWFSRVEPMGYYCEDCGAKR